MPLALRYAKWFLPLSVPFGFGPKRSELRLADGVLHVKMGWAFRAAIPLVNIVSAIPTDRPTTAVGVHGWRGDWLVNGSHSGVVKLTIDPPVQARMAGMPIEVRTLRVSVTDPDALIAQLAAK